MTLIWQPGDPGFWQPEGAARAGTYALIIGVSRYTHLDGSAAALGLGSLSVSALTAYRFFQWLCGSTVSGRGLSACWLLLAPTEQEVIEEPGLAPWRAGGEGAARAAPTLATCEAAVRAWYGAMNTLTAADSEQSRAVCFFSGHGLEITPYHQVLLPEDFRPEPQLRNLALSTDNLFRGMEALPIPTQLFFIDACRTDHELLRSGEIRGQNTLVPLAHRDGRPARRTAPIFYASADGAAALQPGDPGHGISPFGRALIDGLAGAALWQGDCGGGGCQVRITGLMRYLDINLPPLARALGGQQRSKLGGSIHDAPLADVPAGSGRPSRMVPPSPPPPVAPASLRRELLGLLEQIDTFRDNRAVEDLFTLSPRLAPHTRHLALPGSHNANARRVVAYLFDEKHPQRFDLVAELLELLPDETADDHVKAEIARLAAEVAYRLHYGRGANS